MPMNYPTIKEKTKAETLVENFLHQKHRFKMLEMMKKHMGVYDNGIITIRDVLISLQQIKDEYYDELLKFLNSQIHFRFIFLTDESKKNSTLLRVFPKSSNIFHTFYDVEKQCFFYRKVIKNTDSVEYICLDGELKYTLSLLNNRDFEDIERAYDIFDTCFKVEVLEPFIEKMEKPKFTDTH